MTRLAGDQGLRIDEMASRIAGIGLLRRIAVAAGGTCDLDDLKRGLLAVASDQPYATFGAMLVLADAVGPMRVRETANIANWAHHSLAAPHPN